MTRMIGKGLKGYIYALRFSLRSLLQEHPRTKIRSKGEKEALAARERARRYLEENACGPSLSTASSLSERYGDNTLELYREAVARGMVHRGKEKKYEQSILAAAIDDLKRRDARAARAIPEGWRVEEVRGEKYFSCADRMCKTFATAKAMFALFAPQRISLSDGSS